MIVVKRHGMSGHHLWSLEQLENKIVDMREMYNEYRMGHHDVIDTSEISCSSSSGVMSGEENSEDQLQTAVETLFETQEKHSLVGVANVFLGVLFYDLKLDYPVTIISQQGEACGKLLVEVYRVPNPVFEDNIESQVNGMSSPTSLLGQTITCRVSYTK